MDVSKTRRSISPLFHVAGFLVCLSLAAGAQDKPKQLSPTELPGKGLAQHDFFYAGESKEERMSIVRGGKIVWSYTHPAKGEISDATLLSNGNILFAHQSGVTLINTDKKVLWHYKAPAGCETHTAQPIGKDHLWFIQNGIPSKLVVVKISDDKTVREFPLPVGNPAGTHGQFRHARLTRSGTLLVSHMDLGKIAEYDISGKELWSYAVPSPWSASQLPSGNILVTSNKHFVREINRKGETVWEFTPADAPDYKLPNFQVATRLPNGNTLVNNWLNQWSDKLDPANPPVQAVEITPEKKIVWALRAWDSPADLGPSTIIQLLDQPGAAENVKFGDIE
jgi:hypothetical protein